MLLAVDEVIDVEALGLASVAPAATSAATLEDMTLEELEKTMLARALKASGGNVSEAARRLGITRMAMRYRMDKYGLRGAEG